MNKKAYFLSDAHLGSLAYENDRFREQKLVEWLDEIKEDALSIYLVGDIFDFWYEYKYVVPKGFVRLFGKLAELCDKGIDVHFFIGNHDIWTFGYLESEIGMKVHKKPLQASILGKDFYIAHGNGLGKNPLEVKIIEWIFHSNFIRKIYNLVHPSINISLGLRWSKSNRIKKHGTELTFYGEQKEILLVHANELSKKNNIDYYVFGHRHLMMNFMLKNQSQVIFLGDWIHHFSYGLFDGNEFRLEHYLQKE